MRRRPRGSGTIIREGVGWAVRYGPRGHQTYESGFRTRTEAENRLTLIRAEAMQRRLGPATDPKLSPTLSDLATPWLERRKATHAAHAEDKSRWKVHLAPYFGHLRPDEVGLSQIRAWVESERRKVAPGTVRGQLLVLSALYEDLIERHLATSNPCRRLPASLRRLIKPDNDPRTTPFVERLEDVRRIYLKLREDEPGIAVGYAIGALAGLRTSEVFSLRWPSVDLENRRILVSEGRRGGQTKDREPRPVPIQDALLPVLKEWRLTHPGAGLVIPPLTSRGRQVHKTTTNPRLQKALRSLALARSGLGWYEATRHTFASHWAMAGRSLRELQAILGHSSISTTERYAHLSPGWWAPGVHEAFPVSLAIAPAPVAQIRPENAQKARSSRRKG